MSRIVTARCHCGAVELRATLTAPLESAARCTCSFCRRRQAGNVSALWDSVTVVKGAERLRLYQFGTQTAQHYFCSTCGIYTHHRRRSDPTQAGINLGCIDGAEPWTFEPMVWHDGVRHPSDEG